MYHTKIFQIKSIYFLVSLATQALAVSDTNIIDPSVLSHITAPPAEPSVHVFPRAVTEVSVSTAKWTRWTRYTPGDVLISLPPSVVKRSNELLHDNQVCLDSIESDPNFKNKAKLSANRRIKPGIRKRDVPFLTSICGSELLIDDIVRGGPMAMLRGVEIGDMAFRAAGATEAYREVLQYVKSFSGQLGVGTNPDNLAKLAFSLSFQKFHRKKAIQSVNIFDAIDLQIAGKECTSSVSMCTAKCSLHGASMLNCKTKCQKSTTVGTICATTTSRTRLQVKTEPVLPWQVTAAPAVRRWPPPIEKCTDDSSGLPAADFLRVAEERFCKEPHGTERQGSHSYNAMGDDFVPMVGPFGRPNMVNLHLYRIDFKWFGKGCEGRCMVGMRKLVESNCSKKGGGDFMAREGEVYVGCGGYSYKITPAPALGYRRCHEPFPHGDVRERDLSRSILELGDWKEKKIGPDDPALEYSTKYWGTEYKFVVGWLLGCESTVIPMSVAEPIPDPEEKFVFIMADNWIKCNNGGAGGYIDVGCLRYGFSPGRDPVQGDGRVVGHHDGLRRRSSLTIAA